MARKQREEKGAYSYFSLLYVRMYVLVLVLACAGFVDRGGSRGRKEDGKERTDREERERESRLLLS